MNLKECSADDAARRLWFNDRVCHEDIVDALVNALTRVAALEAELSRLRSGLSRVAAEPPAEGGGA